MLELYGRAVHRLAGPSCTRRGLPVPNRPYRDHDSGGDLGGTGDARADLRERGRVTELSSATEAESRPSHAAGIARGAGIIAGLTVLARILGLGRTLVFSQTVGATCLGTAYVTANQVPTLVYELGLGGALASVMVPVLAR